MGQDTRSIFQYLKDEGYDFLIGGFHVKGQVVDAHGVSAWGYGGQTMERGDWIDGKPSPNPADQLNAWKKQVVLCEHELPGTARHDPLAYLQNRTVDWLDHQLAARELLQLDVANTHLVVEHEYPKARIQDRARLTPILQGSIAFVRQIDEAAACMYALQHEVLEAQGIPVQGVGPTGVSQLAAARPAEVRHSSSQLRSIAIPVLGIDIGTGGSRAVVVGDDGGVVASATVRARAVRVARTGLGRAGSRRLVARGAGRRARRARRRAASRRDRSRPSACPARCTAPCSSTSTTRSSGRRSSGAISAPTRSASGSTRRSAPRGCSSSRRNPALTELHADEAAVGPHARARRVDARAARAAAEGLRPPDA